MIDIDKESLITLRVAAGLDVFVNPVTGRAAHRSKVCRAILHGCRAYDGRRIKLEHVRVPGGLRTSREAIARFVAEMTGEVEQAVGAPLRSPGRRARDIAAAEAELAAAGVI